MSEPLTREQIDKMFEYLQKRVQHLSSPESGMLSALRAEVERLTKELEAHAWDISPAMAQAQIYQLNQQLAATQARVERLEAMCLHMYEVHRDMTADLHSLCSLCRDIQALAGEKP